MFSSKKNLSLIAVACCLATLLILPAREASGSPGFNLKIIDLALNKSRARPGDDILVSYQLKLEGKIHQAVQMGILISKVDQSEWVKSWQLPPSSFYSLNKDNDLPISGSLWVQIPHWGYGMYIISIYVDPNNDLSENYRGDNKLKKELSIVNSPPPEEIIDLKITAIEVFPKTPKFSTRFVLNVYVGNGGNAPSGKYAVVLYIKNVNKGYKYPIGTYPQEPMKPGEDYSVYYNTKRLVNEAGFFRVYAEIQPYLFEDSDISNNFLAYPFYVE